MLKRDRIEVRRRALRGGETAAASGLGDSQGQDRSRVPEDVQALRLLGNRDPISGRMLMDINDLPDHAPRVAREGRGDHRDGPAAD